jgi:hypothetical protein
MEKILQYAAGRSLFKVREVELDLLGFRRKLLMEFDDAGCRQEVDALKLRSGGVYMYSLVR